MKHVLVLGAGLAGCTLAVQLANNTVVTLVDCAAQIGGKVRNYGCKATDKCANCGLCLASGLWEKVEELAKAGSIQLSLSTQIVDLVRFNGGCLVTLKGSNGLQEEFFEKVVIATGFENVSDAFAEYPANPTVISGSLLEAKLLENREFPPMESVAFVQCYGSRDLREHSSHCSRVCCAYASRAALMLKHQQPNCAVVMYYMDIQENYEALVSAGVELIRRRPVRLDLEKFDLVVLADGIKQGDNSRQLAELCGLNQDADGFLKYVLPNDTTVMLAGCVSGPKKISETHADALAVANKILLEAGL